MIPVIVLFFLAANLLVVFFAVGCECKWYVYLSIILIDVIFLLMFLYSLKIFYPTLF